MSPRAKLYRELRGVAAVLALAGVFGLLFAFPVQVGAVIAVAATGVLAVVVWLAASGRL